MEQKELIKIKEKADTLIGTRVSCSFLSTNNQMLHDSLIVKSNKILEEKGMCLTYFEDPRTCINTLTILNPSFEILKEDE